MDTAEGKGVDPFEKARAFKEKRDLTYPILVDADGKVRQAYKVWVFPTNVIIDRGGTIRSIVPGFSASSLDHTLQELLRK